MCICLILFLTVSEVMVSVYCGICVVIYSLFHVS